jgi:hypothetical protein
MPSRSRPVQPPEVPPGRHDPAAMPATRVTSTAPRLLISSGATGAHPAAPADFVCDEIFGVRDACASAAATVGGVSRAGWGGSMSTHACAQLHRGEDRDDVSVSNELPVCTVVPECPISALDETGAAASGSGSGVGYGVCWSRWSTPPEGVVNSPAHGRVDERRVVGHHGFSGTLPHAGELAKGDECLTCQSLRWQAS